MNERGAAAPMSYDEHRIFHAFCRKKLGSLPVIQFVHRCKNRRFNPGTCLICGLHFDVLLHIHAESHGFKDAYEMIDAGLVKFDYERYNKCKQKNC